MKLTNVEKENYKAEAIIKLTAFFDKQKERKIYTICTSVSQSGMYRHIKTLVVDGGKIWDISYLVAHLLDLPLKEDGVGISGCGMDMGFNIVYDVGRTLYPNGDGKTITGRNGDIKPETDGGYLIKQEWV